MEQGGRGRFFVSAGMSVGLIPAPVYTDEGEYQPQAWDRPISKEETELENCDPNIFAHPLASVASSLSAAWDNGILPCPGSLMDQPARAVALVHLWKWASYVAEEHLRRRTP